MVFVTEYVCNYICHYEQLLRTAMCIIDLIFHQLMDIITKNAICTFQNYSVVRKDTDNFGNVHRFK